MKDPLSNRMVSNLVTSKLSPRFKIKIKELEIAHLKELINLERENTSVGLNAILQYTIGGQIIVDFSRFSKYFFGNILDKSI